MTMNHNNKSNDTPTRKDRDTQAMHGVDTHLGNAGAMSIGGETFTPATLKKVFQDDIDAANETAAARTNWKLKVQTAATARRRAIAVLAALRAYLIGQNGPEAVQILEDFGFATPKAPGPKTAKAKASGAAKATNTRQRLRDAKAAALATPATATTEPATPATSASASATGPAPVVK
jgi:hypothetical protein